MGIGAYSSSNINLAVSGTSYVMLDLKKWTLFVLVLENTMAKFLRSNQVKLSFKTFFKKNLENPIGNTLTGFPIKLKAFGLKNYYHRLHQKFLYSKIRIVFLKVCIRISNIHLIVNIMILVFRSAFLIIVLLRKTF